MTADVVVLGGGVIGWSCAYHILKASPATTVAVVDRAPSAGTGSTGRAAGGVRAQFGTEINISLSLFSIKEFERFHAEIGVDIGFRQNGYLFVTSTDAGANHLNEVLVTQLEHGVPVRRLNKKEIQQLAPCVSTDDLKAGSYSPTDGYLDPHSVCVGYEKAAIGLGAVPVYSASPVEVTPFEVVIQRCSSTEWIGAGKVVVACGHHTSGLLARPLPIRPEVHQLALTEPVPGLPNDLPMVVDLDTTFHFRREGEGLLIGFNDEATSGRADDPDSTPFFDYGFLERMAEAGLRRLPLLATALFDTRKCWAGFYAETPDRHAIIGEWDDLFVAAGFGGHGVMHAPAAGQAVAELVLRGFCSSFDLHPLRPSRFEQGDLNVEPMVI